MKEREDMRETGTRTLCNLLLSTRNAVSSLGSQISAPPRSGKSTCLQGYLRRKTAEHLELQPDCSTLFRCFLTHKFMAAEALYCCQAGTSGQMFDICQIPSCKFPFPNVPRSLQSCFLPTSYSQRFTKFDVIFLILMTLGKGHATL